MRIFYRLISIIFVATIFSAGDVAISRIYDVNKNIIDVINANQGKIDLEGSISFQACDSSACIPVFQDISHLIFDPSFNQNIDFSESILYEDFGFLITENLSSIDDKNPFVPDWGEIEIEGFTPESDSSVKYTINFKIKSGYHIFTTDTLLSPLGTGNTDIYWEENSLISLEKIILSQFHLLNIINYINRILDITMEKSIVILITNKIIIKNLVLNHYLISF